MRVRVRVVVCVSVCVSPTFFIGYPGANESVGDVRYDDDIVITRTMRLVTWLVTIYKPRQATVKPHAQCTHTHSRARTHTRTHQPRTRDVILGARIDRRTLAAVSADSPAYKAQMLANTHA